MNVSTMRSRSPVAAELEVGNLVQATNGVRGALLASVDGRPIAAVLRDHDERSTAAIVAASHGLGERLAELSGQGELQEIVVRSDAGYVIVYASGDRAVLTVLTEPSVNLAMIHLKARESAQRLGSILGRAS